MAGFAGFLAVAQLPPLAFALRETGSDGLSPTSGFVAGIVVGGAVTLLLHLAGRRSTGQIHRREAIAEAGLAWVLASLIGAIPFLWSGLLLDQFDAVFETVSGWTTCGATVLGSGPNMPVSEVPASLLLWRATARWFGGLGIVSLQMVLDRLELLPLITPSFWRR